jgi:hypothetical protein
MLCFLLNDVHLDKDIYGVKIYKHEIFKNYPYDLNHMSCEVKQIEDLKKDGYNHKFINLKLGKHSPKWTNDLIFNRYFNLMEKYKEYKYNWIQTVPKILYNKILKEPNELNINAFLGAYTSIMNLEKQIGEKDFRSYQIIKGKLGDFRL